MVTATLTRFTDGYVPVCTQDSDCPIGYVCNNNICCLIVDGFHTPWILVALIGGAALLGGIVLYRRR